MTTLDEFRDHVGERVVYRSPAMRAGRDRRRQSEDGVIMRVGYHYVFVGYSFGIAATAAEDLTLLNPEKGTTDD